MGEKDDYDSENSWISDGLPSSSMKNIEKSCSYRQNVNVPPAIKQYKNRGNSSNLVQSHFGSPQWKRLESGIAPLVQRGFDPE